mgnify:CR=1 FL=1|jgi:hypothetical protein
MDNVNKEKLDYRTEVVIGDALQVGSIYIVYISTYRNRKFNVSCIFFSIAITLPNAAGHNNRYRGGKWPQLAGFKCR